MLLLQQNILDEVLWKFVSGHRILRDVGLLFADNTNCVSINQAEAATQPRNLVKSNMMYTVSTKKRPPLSMFKNLQN